MIKAIILDCFGVLTVDIWKTFTDTLSQQDRVQVRSITRAYDSGIIDEQKFISQVAELTSRPEKEVAYAIKPQNVKNKSLLEFVSELKAQGYKIGILSNINNSWITDSFLSEEEQKLFDEVVGSYQLSIAKPDKRVYQYVCDKLGVQPSEAVFVDDIQSYCDAAEDLGMKTIVYKNFDEFQIQIEQLLKV